MIKTMDGQSHVKVSKPVEFLYFWSIGEKEISTVSYPDNLAKFYQKMTNADKE